MGSRAPGEMLTYRLDLACVPAAFHFRWEETKIAHIALLGPEDSEIMGTKVSK